MSSGELAGDGNEELDSSFIEPIHLSSFRFLSATGRLLRFRTAGNILLFATPLISGALTAVVSGWTVIFGPSHSSLALENLLDSEGFDCEG